MRKAVCFGCNQMRLVNYAFSTRVARAHIRPGEYCADCYDRFDLEVRPARTAISATKDETSPWQENAIRELEDMCSMVE